MTLKFDVTAHVHLYASGVNELRDIKETLAQLLTLETKIMTVISDFAAKQNAFNARMDASIQGLTGDVAELNRKIQELQNTSGVITPEDQALLNDLEQRGEAIAQRLEAMDAERPPAPPVG